jgi:acetyltransferase
MDPYKLNCLFRPRQVAVVDASEKAGTIGNALMNNLTNSKCAGTVLPVNPNGQSIPGHACYRSVFTLETGVDLALIATPIRRVVDIVSDCVERAHRLQPFYQQRFHAGHRFWINGRLSRQ